jgi:hypothetical protein
MGLEEIATVINEMTDDRKMAEEIRVKNLTSFCVNVLDMPLSSYLSLMWSSGVTTRDSKCIVRAYCKADS